MKQMEYMGTMTEGDVQYVIKLVNRQIGDYDIIDAILHQYINNAIDLRSLLDTSGQHTLCWPRDEIAWNVFHLVCADWLWHNDNRAIGIFYPERLVEYFPKRPREYNKSVMYFHPACEQRGCRMDVIFLLDDCHEFVSAANNIAQTVVLVKTTD